MTTREQLAEIVEREKLWPVLEELAEIAAANTEAGTGEKREASRLASMWINATLEWMGPPKKPK